ncbi:hypothetical protein ACMXYX_14425 [Neptuniibacter sp. QD72_48]|uniref:hypothetical protein n=1 Tax=unclassified Neptuniibacter TaxID=2630693 RepID=UPI0039F553EF
MSTHEKIRHHERATTFEGILTGVFSCLVFAFFVYRLFSVLRDDIPQEDMLGRIVVIVLGGLFLLAFLVIMTYYSVMNIIGKERFRCTLTTKRFLCQVPISALFGKSFDISLDELSKLERKYDSDGSLDAYLLHLTTGEMIEVTTNFGNPAESFFKDIKLLKPNIALI